MNNLLDVTNAADRAAVIQTNFERLDGVATNIKHVNLAQVLFDDGDGETSLLDSPLTIPAGILQPGDVIRFEAYGSMSGGVPPTITFKVYVGAVFLTIGGYTLGDTSLWKLEGMITVRSIGAAGELAAALDFRNQAGDPFTGVNSIDTRDTTVALDFNLTAETDADGDFAVEQLIVYLQR